MYAFICQFFLFIFCMLGLSLTPLTTATIVALLATSIILCMSYFFNKRILVIILVVIYGIATLFAKELLCFIPLLFFQIGYFKIYPVSLIFIVSITNSYLDFPFYFAYLVLGSLLALWLAFIIEQYTSLQQDFFHLRDDSTERTLLLNERNRSLQKNQDYEIYNATLQERNRIAREIHDNVGHMLTRSILMLGALKAVNKDDNCSDSLNILEDTLTQAMNNIRSSVHNLHDNAINLKESLTAITNEFTFCDISLTYDMTTDLPIEIRYAFLSIAKEALTNSSKHSNATRIQVLAREHPAMYQLIIHDNGTTAAAMNPANFSDLQSNTGIGLTNMRERVQNLGGILQLSNNDGFQIFISIPKKDSY